MPSVMSDPLDASTTTSGRRSARATVAACSTTAEIVDDSGTPANPEAVTPPVSTHITRRSLGPASIRRTSAVTGALVPRRSPSGASVMRGTLREPSEWSQTARPSGKAAEPTRTPGCPSPVEITSRTTSNRARVGAPGAGRRW